MFWLRDRRVPADAGTRIGWIARLSRALVRWLMPRSAIDGNPRQEDPPNRHANPADRNRPQSSPPFYADPNGALSADKADAGTRTDPPPPTVESTGHGPERDDADVGIRDSSAQGAPVASEVPGETAPAPCIPFLPESIPPEEAPSAPAELVEPVKQPAERDREVGQASSETAIEAGEPSTQFPPISIAPGDDPKLEPTRHPPPGSNDDPPGVPPSDAEEETVEASAIAPLPDVADDLDAVQPAQETECPSSQGTTGSNDHDPNTNRDGSRKQSVGIQDRESPDGQGKIPKYRPRLRPPPVPTPSRTAAPSPDSPNSPPGTLEAMYLISFLPGGWGLSVLVLLGRADGMPENLNIIAGGDFFPCMRSMRIYSNRFSHQTTTYLLKASLQKQKEILYVDGSGLHATFMPFHSDQEFLALLACHGS